MASLRGGGFHLPDVFRRWHGGNGVRAEQARFGTRLSCYLRALCNSGVESETKPPLCGGPYRPAQHGRLALRIPGPLPLALDRLPPYPGRISPFSEMVSPREPDAGRITACGGF